MEEPIDGAGSPVNTTQRPENPYTDDDGFAYESPSRNEALASRIILDYIKEFNRVLNETNKGIGYELELIRIGKTASAEEIIDSLFYDLPPREEETDFHKYAVHALMSAVAVLPLFVFPQYALGLALGEVALYAGYWYFKREDERHRGSGISQFIPLRDPSALEDIVGDMMGFVSTFLTDEGGHKSEIERRIDRIVDELNKPGGMLTILEINKIRYEIKKVEGIALMLGHIEVGIEDFRDMMFAPQYHRMEDRDLATF